MDYNSDTALVKMHFPLLLVLVGTLPIFLCDTFDEQPHLYPTIYNRNTTGDIGGFVRFECILKYNATVQFQWFKDNVKLENSTRIKITMTTSEAGPGESARWKFMSILYVSSLTKEDQGFYNCTLEDISPSFVKIIPDRVYLKVADYKKPDFGEPCNKGYACSAANSVCSNYTWSSTGFRCQCDTGYPLYIAQSNSCDKGSFLNEPCYVEQQCKFYTEKSVCNSGFCQCISGYTERKEDKSCVKIYRLGEKCSFDGECIDEYTECLQGKCVDMRLTKFGAVEISTLSVLSVLGFFILLFLVFVIIWNKRQKKLQERESHQNIFFLEV